VQLQLVDANGVPGDDVKWHDAHDEFPDVGPCVVMGVHLRL
jgi:hypothetical protein